MNRGIDSDHFTTQVDQRATAVAGIDRRVGLQEIFSRRNPNAAMFGTDDPSGDRLDCSKRYGD